MKGLSRQRSLQRRAAGIIVMAASLVSVETIRCFGEYEIRFIRHCVRGGQKTEKRLAAIVADHGSI